MDVFYGKLINKNSIFNIFSLFFLISLFGQCCLPYLFGCSRCFLFILFLWSFVSVYHSVFLDSQPQLEGFYKIGSACQSFRLSKFSWNLLISFSWNLAWCFRGWYIVVCGRPKNPHQAKMTINRPQNKVFGLVRKMCN